MIPVFCDEAALHALANPSSASGAGSGTTMTDAVLHD
jgi:hypothetical protein